MSSPPGPPPGAPPAEEALDQLLRQIIEGFFVLTDGQGALSKWSEPAEMLFGHDADSALMEPFFGKLVPTAGLSPAGESWRSFLETGDTPGSPGKVRVDALNPEGRTFAMEAVFVPVKLDEGFDFSLFLEDLGFELPMDMMLLRMRQQHPVVVRALRGALESSAQPWEGVRTAGTLVAFRPLEPTPWMDAAMARREAEAAEAEVELQSRIQALEAPSVTGTDVYDLDDARAVIDRLRWATERIEELEERSRIADVAVQDAADARAAAENAERAALDVRAEMSGVLQSRPVDVGDEAGRMELLARLERVERAATDAVETAAAQRVAVEAARARAAELEAQRAELLARLGTLEQTIGASRQELSREAQERAQLVARLEAMERAERSHAPDPELALRLEALERAHAREAEELQRLRAAGDVRGDVETLAGQVAVLDRLREELETLRERADAQSGIIRRAEAQKAAAIGDAESAREELSAGLRRVEDLSEETARLRARLESAPEQVGLTDEERHKLETAAAGVAEARTGIEAIRHLAEELRAQSVQLREEDNRVQARLSELTQLQEEARRGSSGITQELEALRADREEVRAQLREALRAAEEARAIAERGPARGEGLAPASTDEVIAARARVDELAAAVQSLESRLDDSVGALAELRESAAEAHRSAREAVERAELADRGNHEALAQISTQAAILEEIGVLARSAQIDAGESRADAGEAKAIAKRAEGIVAGVREQVQQAVADAAGAREQAAAAGEAAAAARQLAGETPTTAREAAAEVVAPLEAALRSALEELRSKPAGNPEAEVEVHALRADVDALRVALESAEGGDGAAVHTLAARLDRVEQTVPDGLDARLDSLREGLAGALGRLETVAVDLAAARSETGAGRQAMEQRLADGAAELMAARTDAEQARRGLDGLREELSALREYAAAAKAEAAAAREAASQRSGSVDDSASQELRSELQAALAKMAEYRTGYEEARQAAVAARREAEQARVAAEKAGAVNEVTTEKFTEVWQRMLSTPAGPGHGPAPQRPAPERPVAKGVSKPKEAPPARAPQAGFDDDPRPLAKLDLKGKFKQLNPAFTKLVGYQEHEFGKATWPSVLDRPVYMQQMEQLNAMTTGERETTTVESTYMHGQGLMVLIRGELELVRDAAGEPEHLLLTAEHGGPAAD